MLAVSQGRLIALTTPTPLIARLDRIEETLRTLAGREPLKEWYTTAEAAKLLGRAEYTVREWCCKRQVAAEKASNGRGWLIGPDALTHVQNRGPDPEYAAERFADR
jgi:hypothetical protein